MRTITLARHLDVPSKQVEQLLEDVNSMTPDMALRLACAFSTISAYWMNMQTNCDMAAASKKVDASGIEPPLHPKDDGTNPDIR